ncbi:putative metal-dependent enzyme (double-stranded beta helix superfamily) [Kitasatospora sp. MAP12-15]|uniref:cysteine dioxygenase family protein n=1 Tax=unclassified Kitasatospora TaxID=2633591 RepID=UPI0024765652|nr:cysteine dioxygenase family protein [Kitasatospora sp. MAP12-44]MDH6108564.1 putative metal-dependent enzyme (double-stranded beta helix superfamily) [Kitasatospora sp. MAP12-44]
MTTPITTLPTTLLAELTAAVGAQVRAAADPEECARRVADTLAPFLRHSDLLPPAQQEPDPAGYRQHLLHAEPDGSFSVVALVWLPGQQTRVHDHVSWCVVGTLLGAEEETVYRLAAEADRTVLVPVATTVHPAGAVTYVVPPGDIHRVCNATSAKTVSLHIYGLDIRPHGTSIRRVYDEPVRVPTGSSAVRTPGRLLGIPADQADCPETAD